MPRKQRVALVQMRAVALDAGTNAAATAAAIEAAADSGAGIVVLPELVASGYVPDRASLMSIAESVARPGTCLAAWQAAARGRRVTVIGGFPELHDGRLYNSAVTIAPTGSIVSVYRKLHLFGNEWDCFTPGDRGLPIVAVDGVSIGVLVCYDLRFPETMRIMALRGAELIAVPTAWVAGFDKSSPPDGRIGQVDGAIVQANLNQVFVACADQVGSTTRTSFLGRSVAVGPYGEILAGPASPTEEETLLVDIDTEDVQRARHRGRGIDPFENRRADVYGELLGYQEPESDGIEG